MSGDVHVRFCEGLGVKFPRATLPAESGLLFQRFAENLTAALPPEAAIKLILSKEAANDPKRTSEIRDSPSV